jgi:hypothetical protein
VADPQAATFHPYSCQDDVNKLTWKHERFPCVTHFCHFQAPYDDVAGGRYSQHPYADVAMDEKMMWC